MAAATIASIVIGINAVEASSNPATTTTTTVLAIPSTTTTTVAPVESTTTTTTIDPAETQLTLEALQYASNGGKCPEWYIVAANAGWPSELLPDILDEAWNESRCLPIGPDSAYPKYWAGDNYSKFWNGHDYGVLQINRAAHHVYVESLFGDMDALVDPANNFAFGWRLYSELEARGRCGFKPWSRKCRK